MADQTTPAVDRFSPVRLDASEHIAREIRLYVERKGLKQISDPAAIEKAIDEVMAKSPGQLADYRAGKDKLFGYFVGQVMKATGGKANPAQLNELLKKKLP